MYYIVFGFLYLLSLLPMFVLYRLSDFAYFLLYYVIGYRKKVVLHNLDIAFPQKTDAEKIRIAKQFYKNFCDTFIETIKFISAGKNFFQKRFTANFECIEEIYPTGRSVQVHLGHNFNWELANMVYPFHTQYKVLAVYLPIKNKIFDRLFYHLRSKNGSHLIATTRFKEDFAPHKNTQYLIGLVADQNPAHPDNAYWIRFFGKPTPFVRGPEKAARRNNLPVIFAHFTKKKRGHYIGHARVATLNPQQMREGELTKMYAAYLQEVMTQYPEMWLWSHRRWKFAWKAEFGPVLDETT
jgi:Kdo2-lipid IVA lauroyltransferase/acyltransferase